MPSLDVTRVPPLGADREPMAIEIGAWAAALAGILLVYAVGVSVYRIWFHPLKKFPGPWYFAISSLPFSYQDLILGSFSATARDLHKKYGDIVRVAPDWLIVDGKFGFTDIFAHRPGGDATEFRKIPAQYGETGHRGIIGAPTREAHRRQRRLLSHAFSDAAMYEQEPIIMFYVDLLIKRLSEHSAKGKPLNMVSWLNFVTFDIIGDLAMGESFGSLENSDYHFWVSNLFNSFKGGSRLRFFSTISPLLVPLGVLLDREGVIKKYRNNRSYGAEKTKARASLGLTPPVSAKDVSGVDGKPKMTVRRDFMTYMLKKDGVKYPLTEDELIENATTIIAAGSETTATNLSTLFFLLALPRNRAIHDAAVTEVRALFQKEADVTLRSVHQKALPFLHACIEEALRFHPPVAEIPPRVSPGGTVNGQFVPKGTVVQIFQIATYHNPDNFHEADSYRPQRFLPKTHPMYDSKFANDNMACFHPFSTGPRDCIGKNLAYAEMRLIAARILLRFNVELAPGAPEDWLEQQRVFVIWDKSPLMFNLTERTGLELKG